MLFFGNNFFFHSNLDFYLNECTESWKINICCRKTTILLKTSNSDAMLLSASNIAAWAHDDDSSRNQSKILRFSKNLDFWQFLKIEFELHICCHDYDLSNIINWQHIRGGPSARNFCRNFCFLTTSQSNFHLWCRFFSCFDKINNFWQQKQQVLFLRNMTPKVLLT